MGDPSGRTTFSPSAIRPGVAPSAPINHAEYVTEKSVLTRMAHPALASAGPSVSNGLAPGVMGVEVSIAGNIAYSMMEVTVPRITLSMRAANTRIQKPA